jgi:hypothetical protein
MTTSISWLLGKRPGGLNRPHPKWGDAQPAAPARKSGEAAADLFRPARMTTETVTFCFAVAASYCLCVWFVLTGLPVFLSSQLSRSLGFDRYLFEVVCIAAIALSMTTPYTLLARRFRCREDQFAAAYLCMAGMALRFPDKEYYAIITVVASAILLGSCFAKVACRRRFFAGAITLLTNVVIFALCVGITVAGRLVIAAHPHFYSSPWMFAIVYLFAIAASVWARAVRIES